MKAKNTGNATSAASVLTKPEFWATFVTCVSGLLLAFGVITPEQSKGLEIYVPNIIGAILSLLSSFKFINVQHAARVEVFRAMCATNLAKTEARVAGIKDGSVPAGAVAALALTEDDAQREVSALARAAGL